jgi:hypothetical protein
VEAVPFSWGYVADDGIFGPLRWDRSAKGDGDEEACGGAFGIYRWVDAACFVPGIRVLSYVLGGYISEHVSNEVL